MKFTDKNKIGKHLIESMIRLVLGNNPWNYMILSNSATGTLRDVG